MDGQLRTWWQIDTVQSWWCTYHVCLYSLLYNSLTQYLVRSGQWKLEFMDHIFTIVLTDCWRSRRASEGSWYRGCSQTELSYRPNKRCQKSQGTNSVRIRNNRFLFHKTIRIQLTTCSLLILKTGSMILNFGTL